MRRVWFFGVHSPSKSLTLCFSDKACIWVRSAVLCDREAQQRSRARASVQDSGCGGSVIRSACLFTLRAVQRCLNTEHRVCRNRPSREAFTPNLREGQTNTDTLNPMTVGIHHACYLHVRLQVWGQVNDAPVLHVRPSACVT